MESCIYEGYIEHRRIKPAEHHFRYPLYFYCFDLDELDELDRCLPLFGYNRLRPSSLTDGDYLDDTRGTVREKLLRIIDKESFSEPLGRILLITSARYFNYIFNPVSFYYCLSPDNELRCVVAEVNNTFGDKHVYVLSAPEETVQGFSAHFKTEKKFHVSPFNNLAGCYDFLFSRAGEEIDIRIDLHRDGETIFQARLHGKRRPLTPSSHAAMLLKHPLVPHLAMPRILYQAARLFFQKKLRYHDRPVPVSPMTIRTVPPGTLQKGFVKLVARYLKGIRRGGITLTLPEGDVQRFGDVESPPQGEILVRDYRFFSSVVLGGDVGLGEAYMEGYWDTDDITELFRVFIRNRDVLKDGYPVTAWLTRRKNDLLHLARANTPGGARKNIKSHYDLSNDFFSLFLDSSMTYSSGLYLTDRDTLEEAQRNKRQSIIEKARIQEGDRVLEIGCGWGGFAIQAALERGCPITGITISEEQQRFALNRLKEENLQGRVTILLRDYRHIDGVFDRIVSIEMLEAVGERYIEEFFERCDRLLTPGGLLVIQVITVPDQRFKEYRKETDWIQKHIFPGGFLPSLAFLAGRATKHSSLVMEQVEDIGQHYARTLKDWRNRFMRNLQTLEEMGYDRSFQRKWCYYLSICESGFAERALGNMQIVFRKPL